MAALVKYKYLGMSSVVEVDYSEPQVKLDLWGQAPGSYTGLDRFGRVIDHRWINYGADPEEDVARIQHGYDRNSNRLWRQNDVARALSKKFDQQYTYDGLNRLTDARTGLLNGSHVIPSGGDTTFQQEWSLDYVGNWSCFKQDDDGGGTFDLEQTRAANEVNEITDIDASVGAVWTTPVYDAAGNTTSFPKPAAPTESFTAVYDAWNRMVRVTDDEDDDATVQENVYDGRNFRVIKKTYDAGILDETRHIYYTSSWQAIEERLGSSPDSADPAQQYVWGIRYIDDLALRDRDASEPPDGTLDERLYAIQDPNWNVTTIIDNSSVVQERYEYEAYGSIKYLSNSFHSIGSGSVAWNIGFAGYYYDLGLLLSFARRRILHTQTGSWLTRDFLGYFDYFNLYSYVRNMTINRIDPTGSITIGQAEINPGDQGAPLYPNDIDSGVDMNFSPLPSQDQSDQQLPLEFHFWLKDMPCIPDPRLVVTDKDWGGVENPKDGEGEDVTKHPNLGNCLRYATGSPKYPNGDGTMDPYIIPKTISGAYNCSNMEAGFLLRKIPRSNASDKCPPCHYKIAGLVTNNRKSKTSENMHFLREKADGTGWEHKALKSKPTDKDADGKLIKSPATANFNYGPDVNYSIICGYWCWPYQKSGTV